MKTHIIQLENHDDVYSTSDKMAWGKSGQILLVIPRDNDHFYQKLDFILLKRKAGQLGAKLGIVTTDADRINMASALAISVFDSAKQAQQKTWHQGIPSAIKPETQLIPHRIEEFRNQLEKSKLPDLENSWIRIVIFTIAVFSVVILLAILVPKAVITLQPEQRIQIEELTLKGVLSPDDGNSSGTIPVQKLTVEIQQQGTIPVSGSMNIPAGKARGIVEAKNISQLLVEIPEGTRIISKTDPDVVFLTVRAASITSNGGTTTIPVEAQLAGSNGNRMAGDLATIEGDLNSKLLVSNPEPMSGGTDQLVKSVAQVDYDGLRTKLIGEMRALAIEKEKSQLPENSILLPDSIEMEPLVTEVLSPEVNQPGDQLSLTITSNFLVYYLDVNKLNEKVQSLLDYKIPDGWVKRENTLYEENLHTSITNFGDSKEFMIILQAAQLLVPQMDKFTLAQAVAGKTKAMAAEIIKNEISLLSEPTIKINPSFWQWLPILPVNIDVSEH